MQALQTHQGSRTAHTPVNRPFLLQKAKEGLARGVRQESATHTARELEFDPQNPPISLRL